MHPNKLFLFGRTFELEDPSWVHMQVVNLVAKVGTARKWQHSLTLPTHVEREEVRAVRPRLFRSDVEKVVCYNYYLVFDNPIDEKELLFWNGLVAGMRFWNIRHWQDILE